MAKASVVDMVLAMVEKFGVDVTRTIMDECDWLANDPIEDWKVEEYIQQFASGVEAKEYYGFETTCELWDEFFVIDCGKDGIIVFEQYGRKRRGSVFFLSFILDKFILKCYYVVVGQREKRTKWNG